MNLPKLTNNPILHSRPRAEVDWTCPRKRYWDYEYAGVGLEGDAESLEQFLGTTIHDASAVIAEGKVDIDLIATTAHQQMFESLTTYIPGTKEEVEEYANEQSSLVEGLIRGYHKHQWPRLLERFPKVLAIEKDVTFRHDHNGNPDPSGNFIFMAKPDLILEGPEGAVYIEHKTTKSKKIEWINQWEKSVQVHATREAIKQSLGIDCVGVIVQGWYKGYLSYGKLSSPFCYAYHRWGNPPFTQTETCLVPETKVLTRGLRWVQLGDVKVGDTLVGFDEEPIRKTKRQAKRQWRSSVVEKVGRTTLPCYELTFEDGTVVTCSENHLWLIGPLNGKGLGSGSWLETKKLKAGPQNACHVYKPLDVWETDRSYDGGYLRAALEGEGSLSYAFNKASDSLGVRLSFAQKPGKMLDAVRQCLEAYGFPVYETDSDSGVKNLTVSRRKGVLTILGRVRPERLLDKLDLNKVGAVRPSRLPVRLVSKRFVGDREVVTIQTSTKTLLAEGLATHNCYEYKAGYKRYPVWTLDGGVKKWVEEMPEQVLMEQFPQTPLIFPNEEMTRRFFAQRAMRELDIRMGRETILNAKETDDQQTINSVLTVTFPQKFKECTPAHGFECPRLHLCWGGDVDPLKAGCQLRTPHHAAEIAANKEKEAVE